MEHISYIIYEMFASGHFKKASPQNFRTREEAEKSIIKSFHPMDRDRMIAVKVGD